MVWNCEKQNDKCEVEDKQQHQQPTGFTIIMSVFPCSNDLNHRQRDRNAQNDIALTDARQRGQPEHMSLKLAGGFML
jgi:hypothetical protein